MTERSRHAGARTTVATANILYTLGLGEARTGLTDVLALEPDLVGLEEWYPPRFGLLRETARVGLVRGSGIRLGHVGMVAVCTSRTTRAWRLCRRCARGPLRAARMSHWLLSGPGRADRKDKFLGLEPPRFATVGVYPIVISTGRSRWSTTTSCRACRVMADAARTALRL